EAAAVALADDGGAAIVGHTQSRDFPVTSGAFQGEKAGDDDRTDLFFARLNPRGSALVYSTYLGRPLDERGGGVAIVGEGRYAVSGTTASPSFPIDKQGRTASPAGRADAF